MKLLRTLPFMLLCSCTAGTADDFVAPALPQIPDYEVLLTDFGALADGQTLCTSSFTQAINHLDSLGGGTLQIPAGEWITGPIVLHSHIRLNLEDGALIRFSPELELFATRNELFGTGEERRQAPIVAYKATDVAITGKGVIDGGGDRWRPMRRGDFSAEDWAAIIADTLNGITNADGSAWMPIRYDERAYCQNHPVYHNDKLMPWWNFKSTVRPENIWLYECERVLLDGITFQNSPFWNVHPELCRELTVRDCTIQNEWFATNGDGLDLESCSHVLVKNCKFDVGDDAVCLKSGANEAGRLRGRPTEDVLVEDCEVRHAHGGFVVGSEMSGGVHNVLVRRCYFEGTESGLRFKTNRQRGGVVDNIIVEDITMQDITADAFLFDMYYHGQTPIVDVIEGHSVADTAIVAVSESTPSLRGVHFSNITCRNVGRTFYFDGIRESPIQNITIEGLNSQAQYPSLFSECKGIHLSDVNLSAEGNQQILIYNAQDLIAEESITSLMKDITPSK